MRFNCEFDSKEIDVSKSQKATHDNPRISTLHGIIIDSSDEDENAFDSIRISREFDSNEMDESDSHDKKHDEPKISISDGIVT
jgi:hypothetical protein